MAKRKLGRDSAHRKAMLRNLTTSVLENERIETTETRAKETRRIVEKMITLGKRGDLSARRQALEVIKNLVTDAYIDEDDNVVIERLVDKVFGEYAERYADRDGGYTRILKIGPRRGDGAPMVILELV